MDADRLERVTGVQIGQIERVLEEDRDFVNGHWEVQSRSKEQAGLLPPFLKCAGVSAKARTTAMTPEAITRDIEANSSFHVRPEPVIQRAARSCGAAFAKPPSVLFAVIRHRD